MIDPREIKDGYTNCKICFIALRNEEVDIHLGHFENSTISGPINFFVKAVEKKEGKFYK